MAKKGPSDADLFAEPFHGTVLIPVGRYARVRAHAESIAFFGGGASESAGAARVRAAALAQRAVRHWADFWFVWMRTNLLRAIPGIQMNLLRFKYAAEQCFAPTLLLPLRTRCLV